MSVQPRVVPINFHPVIQRHKIAQMAVAVDDVIFERFHHPMPRHIALDHLQEFIFQRVHLLAAAGRRRRNPSPAASLADGPRSRPSRCVDPRSAEPGFAVARLRLELQDGGVGRQRRRLGDATAAKATRRRPSPPGASAAAPSRIRGSHFFIRFATIKIVVSPARWPATEKAARARMAPSGARQFQIQPHDFRRAKSGAGTWPWRLRRTVSAQSQGPFRRGAGHFQLKNSGQQRAPGKMARRTPDRPRRTEIQTRCAPSVLRGSGR